MEMKAEDSNITPFDCANILQLYKCEICDFATNLKLLLKRHVSQVHKNHSSLATDSQKSYSCEKCNFQTCSVLVLYKHVCTLVRCILKNEKPTWFQCELCKFKSKWRPSFWRHLKLMHSTGKSHPCTHCERTFARRIDLQKHISLVRSKRNKKPRRLFQCEHCKYKSQWRKSLEAHLKVVHLAGDWYHCEHFKSCKFKTVWKQSLKEHLRVVHSDGDRYHCKHCKSKFARKLFLKKHLSEEHCENEKWLHCEHCGYKTNRIYTLTAHMKYKHGISTWFECKRCQSKFEQKVQLRKHIQLQHTVSKVKWYQCEYCEYITTRSTHIKNHLSRRHSNNHKTDPHQCDRCDYKTELKSSLVRHLELEHSVKSNFKYFNCFYCEQIFMLKAQLTKHEADQHSVEDKSAKSFHCQHCDYKARCLNTLKQHVFRLDKDHKKDRGYRCEHCENTFKFKVDFEYHLLELRAIKAGNLVPRDQ